jgi:hypothetical protein
MGFRIGSNSILVYILQNSIAFRFKRKIKRKRKERRRKGNKGNRNPN